MAKSRKSSVHGPQNIPEHDVDQALTQKVTIRCPGPLGFKKTYDTFGALAAALRSGQIFTSTLAEVDGQTLPLTAYPQLAQTLSELEPNERLDVDGLVAFLVQIWRERRDGRLFVQTRTGSKIIVFRQGVPCDARSNIESEWLGQRLLQSGAIKATELEEAIAQLTEINQKSQFPTPIGTILLQRNRLTDRTLKQALSSQTLDRCLSLFLEQDLLVRFVPGDISNESLTLVLNPRDFIEVGLSLALSPRDVTRALSELDRLETRVARLPEGSFSDADHAALQLLCSGEPLKNLLPQVATALSATPASAKLAILTYWKLGLFGPLTLKAGTPEAELATLDQIYRQLVDLDYFQRLEVRRAATPVEVNEALHQAMARQGAELRLGDKPEIAQARERIRKLLDEAAQTLRDEEERFLYQRTLQLGLDYHDPLVRARVKADALEAEAQTLLQEKLFSEARARLEEARSLCPYFKKFAIELVWVEFLSGPPTEPRGSKAKLELSTMGCEGADREFAWLIRGRIERNLGHPKEAESAFARILEWNPHHVEALSELSLLSTPHRRTMNGKGLFIGSLAATIFLFIAFFVGANIAAGGAQTWPTIVDEPEFTSNLPSTLEGEHFQEMLTRAQYAAHAKEVDLTIPPEERVLGNVEYYYQVDDAWWWIRRAALTVFGLILLLALAREGLSTEVLGEKPVWALAALPYGAVVGLFSYVQTPTPLPVALGMTFFHTLAEQIFFFWFLARVLSRLFQKLLPFIAVMSGLYAVYQLTFFAAWQQPLLNTILQVLQFGVFSAGAQAFLFYKSRGLLAPFVAQLVMTATMMLHCVNQ